MSVAKRRQDGVPTPAGREGLRKGTSSPSQSSVRCPVCDLTVQTCRLKEHHRQELEHLDIYMVGRRKREQQANTYTDAEGLEQGAVLKKARQVLDGVKKGRVQFASKYCGQLAPSTCGLHNRPQAPPFKSHDQPGPSSFSSDEQPGPSIKRHNQPGPSSEPCPMCGEPLPEGEEERESHVQTCLGSQEESDGDMSHDEYTWCNETRVRVTSFLDPSSRASMVNGTVIAGSSQEEEVDVEKDTTEVYGPPQFSDSDLVRTDSGDTSKEGCGEMAPQLTPPTSMSSRCVICLGDYTQPLVSVHCWHVFCEDCWLQALATLKLCPTCKIITCPTDLRRIFL